MEKQMDLRELIRSRVMTYLEVADAGGMSESNLSSLANGHSSPKVMTMRKLAKALGVPDETVYRACMETQRRKELANVH